MFFLRRINGRRALPILGGVAPASPVRASPLADIGGNTAPNLPIAYRKALAAAGASLHSVRGQPVISRLPRRSNQQGYQL